jgi:DNA gyrase subunit A
VIKTIRESYDDAKEKLMERFKLSDIQAQAILDMRLARLQGLERKKIDDEYNALLEKIAYLEGLLKDEAKLMGVIKDELIEIKEKYGDKRRTSFESSDEEIDEEDLIEEKNVAITLTNLGYIKRIDSDAYKKQKRGGRGKTGLTTREEDFVRNLFITSTHDHLMFFTNRGRAYKIKAYNIPEAGRTARGIPIVNFLDLMTRETVTAMLPVKEFAEDKYLIAVTKNGTIKKTALAAYVTNRSKGVVAINLKEGDELIDIKETSGTNVVLIITKKGKCISFKETDVRAMGRMAGGVSAIKLSKDDEVVSMALAEENEQLLVVSKNGYGKRTPVRDYAIHKRGGKGMLTYAKDKFAKTGELVGAMVVNNDDEVLLINSDGVIIRISAANVSQSSRSTMGVKIMRLEEGGELIAIAKVVKEDDDDEAEDETQEKEGKEGKVDLLSGGKKP